MKLRLALTLFVLLLSAALLQAQVVGTGPSGSGSVGVAVFDSAGCVCSTTNSPFSADVVTETDRVLADGTRIHQETHGKTIRDSQGRTREDNEIIFVGDGEKMEHVTIHDPVQQVMITLDSRTKIAFVHHLQIPKVENAKAPDQNAVATLVARAQQAKLPERSNTSEKLGDREIEGVLATGTRITTTIATGTIGNDRPLVSTHETWFSNELKTVLLTVSDDPQFGKTTRRLQNIQRIEPDLSLFQVPSDYTVKDSNQAQ